MTHFLGLLRSFANGKRGWQTTFTSSGGVFSLYTLGEDPNTTANFLFIIVGMQMTWLPYQPDPAIQAFGQGGSIRQFPLNT